jgi:hypothetical protein
VELLFLGAFGAGEEVESEIGLFGFYEELFYGAEELCGFFGEAGGEEKAEDARVVVAEVDLLAVGEFDGEEMAEVGAEIFEGLVGGEEDAPAFGPGLVDESIEQRGFGRDADEVGSEVRELRTLRAFVERLVLFFGFENDFEDAGLARGVEKGVERLEIFAQKIGQAELGDRGRQGLGGGPEGGAGGSGGSGFGEEEVWSGGRVNRRNWGRRGRPRLRGEWSARFLRNNAKNDDGIACTDFVAVGESGFLDAGAVEESAVAAVEIADATAFGVALESAVDTGHTRVVGKRVFGFGGAADAQGLAEG